MFSFSCTKERKNEVPFSTAVVHGQLMRVCFPNTPEKSKNEITETDEEGKKWGVSM